MRRGILLAMFTSFAYAEFTSGQKVPLDRLISNVTAHFKNYPNQAEAHYLLGRLESLAFSGKADSLEVIKTSRAQLPLVAPWSWVQEKGDAPPSATSLIPKVRQLFFSSIRHYRDAIALDPKVALYHFSLGWMAEQGQRFASQLESPAINFDQTGPKTWQLLAIQETGRRTGSLKTP